MTVSDSVYPIGMTVYAIGKLFFSVWSLLLAFSAIISYGRKLCCINYGVSPSLGVFRSCLYLSWQPAVDGLGWAKVRPDDLCRGLCQPQACCSVMKTLFVVSLDFSWFLLIWRREKASRIHKCTNFCERWLVTYDFIFSNGELLIHCCFSGLL